MGEAVKLCKEKGVNWCPSTLQQNISRGLFRGQKVRGMLYVEVESHARVIPER